MEMVTSVVGVVMRVDAAANVPLPSGAVNLQINLSHETEKSNGKICFI